MRSNIVDMPRPLTLEEAHAELREKMIRDTGHAWNTLVALARYGFTDEIKLEAAQTMLSCVGLGPNGRGAAPPPTPGGRKLVPLPSLPQLSVEEAQAIKVLAEAQRKRNTDNDSGE